MGFEPPVGGPSPLRSSWSAEPAEEPGRSTDESPLHCAPGGEEVGKRMAAVAMVVAAMSTAGCATRVVSAETRAEITGLPQEATSTRLGFPSG